MPIIKAKARTVHRARVTTVAHADRGPNGGGRLPRDARVITVDLAVTVRARIVPVARAPAEIAHGKDAPTGAKASLSVNPTAHATRRAHRARHRGPRRRH
jgi:hypothetical protein